MQGLEGSTGIFLLILDRLNKLDMTDFTLSRRDLNGL